jgi:hypothetical protein
MDRGAMRDAERARLLDGDGARARGGAKSKLCLAVGVGVAFGVAALALVGGDGATGRAALGAFTDVPVACLEACRNATPTLVSALEAEPMDCAAIQTTEEQFCVFTEPACGPGDTRVVEAIQHHCPDALEADPASASSAALGRENVVEPGPTSLGTYRLAPRRVARSEETAALNPVNRSAYRSPGVGRLGKWDYSVARLPSRRERREERRFTLHTSCIDAKIRNKWPEIFGPDETLTHAYVVHHNMHDNDPNHGFFELHEGEEMINGAVNFLKCVSTKLGLVCPTSDGIFEVTTRGLNYEFGFVVKSENGKALYEIGGNGAPLFERKCHDTQQFGAFWNRIVTLERNAKDISYVFGGCAASCPIPEFWCPEGSWYLGGTCSLACPPGYGGSGSTPTTRRCTQCPTNCNKCLNGQCTECTNRKFLHNGECLAACPSGFRSGGSKRLVNVQPSDFDEFDTSEDASSRYSQPVFENGYPMIYFGHGYGVTGTAAAEDVFHPALDDANDWNEAWIGATMDDRCQLDRYSAGRYCTFDRVNGDGAGSCCTAYGKTVYISIVVEDSSSPEAADLVANAGFRTQVGYRSANGQWMNANSWLGSAGSPYGRYAWRNVTFTLRVRRTGDTSLWIGHSLKTQGEPTRAADFTGNLPAAFGVEGANMGRFKALQVSKTGGWAEGGAVASEISGAVKTERNWFTGRTCVAA